MTYFRRRNSMTSPK